MPSKYIQLTATGPVAAKNNLCFEYLGNSKYGYYEYVWVGSNGDEIYYLYCSSADKLIVFNTDFAEATSTPSAHGDYLQIKQNPEPPLDIQDIKLINPTNLLTQSSAITAATSINVSIPVDGNYLFMCVAPANTHAYFQFSIIVSGSMKLYITRKMEMKYGLMYHPFYVYGNQDIKLEISAISGYSINIPANSLKFYGLNETLVISQGMKNWLSCRLACDYNDEAYAFDYRQNYGTPANEYYAGTNYDSCVSDSIYNTSMDDIKMLSAKSSDRTAHKLQTIGDYYCCGRQVIALMPTNLAKAYYFVATQPTTKISYTSPTKEAGKYQSGGYFYYDIPMIHRWCNFPITTMNGANSINKLQAQKFTQDGAGTWNTSLASEEMSYMQTFTGHTETGLNSSSILSSSGQYTIMCGKLPSTSQKSTYFAIEMAVKLSNGRIIRVQPYVGNVVMYVNGTSFVFSITASSSWTSYTSSSLSTRLVYRLNSGNKTVTYCSGYYVSSNSYIRMSQTKTTVYGSSGTSTGTSYAGTYNIGKSTTATSVTFTTEMLNDVSNGRVGFKILSGF